MVVLLVAPCGEWWLVAPVAGGPLADLDRGVALPPMVTTRVTTTMMVGMESTIAHRRIRTSLGGRRPPLLDGRDRRAGVEERFPGASESLTAAS